MIPIFDLDDTLYPERDYVESGFSAVAEWGTRSFGWPAAQSTDHMRELLGRHGRGKVFDMWLTAMGTPPSRRLVQLAVHVYHHHVPQICMPTEHRDVLQRLASKSPLYLVTDGHKVVQQKKILALNIAPLFSRIYITHRYGIDCAKPSPYCFDLIRRRASASWSDMIYIGDNPAKDFVTLNKLGGTTIRVLSGPHSDDSAAKGFDASYRIHNLTELPSLLERLPQRP